MSAPASPEPSPRSGRAHAAAARTGTQSVERAVKLLKELSVRGTFGWRLSDLAERCEIEMATAHRILACLIKERLAQQRRSDRHYLPGPLLFELGLSQPSLSSFQSACEMPVRRIAKRYRAIAAVYLRSGADYVCASRAGSATVQAISASVGTRRPLITSAGGAAIVIALKKAEARAIVADNVRRLEHLGPARLEALRAVLANSESCGYGVHQGEVVPGITAYGIVIRDRSQVPIASLCVAGASDVFPGQASSKFIEAMKAEARGIGLAAPTVPDSERERRRVVGEER